MNEKEFDAMMSTHTQMLRSVQRHTRMATYAVCAALVIAGIGLGIAFELWQESRALFDEARTTMQRVERASAKTEAVILDAQQTMRGVRATTNALAPVLTEAQNTAQEAQATTERVEKVMAPLDFLRSIPFVGTWVP